MQKVIEKIANEITKKAGTWSLPDSTEKISKLEIILKSLKEGSYIKNGPNTALYEILGDDQLFDKIDKELRKAYQLIYPYVKTYIIKLIDDYEKNPENFKKSLDIKTLRKIL
jgi:hypothetical protein